MLDGTMAWRRRPYSIRRVGRWRHGSASTPLLRFQFHPQPLLAVAKLRRERDAEVFRREDLPYLDLRVARHGIRAALHPLDRLLQGCALPDPEARHQLL